ncbi:hypothetical protein QBC34DRAFT_418799 [Podospora aff. communis PSN243]|uniref:Integral membrane protein n=1 Tax=Podospora aff. communis PSN243 TaxID=3040156 RepID=A0AAV9G4J5_9PEZI|nr:hypothetical protein QBC34DRAFT_418799 [Podospora aff. communis PSN243]
MNSYQGGHPNPYPPAPQPHPPQAAYPTAPAQAPTQSQPPQTQQHQQTIQYQQPAIQYQQQPAPYPQQPAQYPQQQPGAPVQQTVWAQQPQATTAPQQQTPQYQAQHQNPAPQQQQQQQQQQQHQQLPPQYPQQHGAVQQQVVGYPHGPQQTLSAQQYPPVPPYQQPTTGFLPPPLPPRPIAQPAPYGSVPPGSVPPPMPHVKTSSGMKSRFGATVAGFQSKLGGYMAKMQTPPSSAYPGAPGVGAAAPQPHAYGQPYGQQLQQGALAAQGQVVPGVLPYGQTPQAVQQQPGAVLGQPAQQTAQAAQTSQPLSGAPYGQQTHMQPQPAPGAQYGQKPHAPQANLAQPATVIPYGQPHQTATQGNFQAQAYVQQYQPAQTHAPTPPSSVPPYGQQQPPVQTVQAQSTAPATSYGQQQHQQPHQQPIQLAMAAASPGPYGQQSQHPQAALSQQPQFPQTIHGQQPYSPHQPQLSQAVHGQQPAHGQQAPSGALYGQQQGLPTPPLPTGPPYHSQHPPGVQAATAPNYPMQPYQTAGISLPYPASGAVVGAAPPAASPAPSAQGMQHPAYAQPNASPAASTQTTPQSYLPQNSVPSPGSPLHTQVFQAPHYQPVSSAAFLPGSPAPASPPPSGAPVGLPIVGTPAVGTPEGPRPISYSQAPPWVSQPPPGPQSPQHGYSQPHASQVTGQVSEPVNPALQLPAGSSTSQQAASSSDTVLTPSAPVPTQPSSQDSRPGEFHQQPAPSLVAGKPQATTQSSTAPATQTFVAVDTGGVDSCWPIPDRSDDSVASHPIETGTQQPPIPEKVLDVGPPVGQINPPAATESMNARPKEALDHSSQPSQSTAVPIQKPTESLPAQASPNSEPQRLPMIQESTRGFPPQSSQPPTEPQSNPAQPYPPQIPLQQPLSSLGQSQPSALPQQERQSPPLAPASSSARPSSSADSPQPASWSLTSLTSEIESLLISSPQTAQTLIPEHTNDAFPVSHNAYPVSNNAYPVNGEAVVPDYFPYPMFVAPFSSTPKARACMGNGEVYGLRKWYAHPSSPSFNVCEFCYDAYVVPTKFAPEFTSREQNNLRCGFHVLRITRVLWPRAVESGDISPVVDYMKRRSSGEVKFCGGPAGNPKSDGITWYDCEEQMPVYGVCEACYEDVFVGGPFEGRFSVCRREQPEGELWNCGNWSDSYTRLVLKGDWERFVSHVNDRVKLGPCDGEPKMAHGTRWWTVRGMGPQANFHICATCYHDTFKDSRSEGVVEPLESVPYQQLACDWNHKNNPNVGIALYSAESRKLGAEELRRALFATLSKPKCGTQQPFENGRYYNIRGSPINSFGVCEACYESRISVLGLSQFFTETPQVVPGLTFCSFNPSANRSGMLLTQFLEAINTGVWSVYEDRARVLTSSPDCEGINAMKGGKWWGWPECTVCETCFYSFACNTKLAAEMPLQGAVAGPDESHICGLFSGGQRKRYLQACQKGDLAEFLEFSRERQVKWGELWPAIQRLQAEISRTYWAGEIASISSHFNRTSDAITFGTPTTQYVTSSGNRYNSYRGVIAEQEAAQAETLYQQSLSPRAEQARLLAIWGMWE